MRQLNDGGSKGEALHVYRQGYHQGMAAQKDVSVVVVRIFDHLLVSFCLLFAVIMVFVVFASR